MSEMAIFHQFTFSTSTDFHKGEVHLLPRWLFKRADRLLNARVHAIQPRIDRTALDLAQFNNLSLNIVTFRKHSAQKLSKTIRTDPCGVLNVNELKRESVLIRASCYALPISHLKWQTFLGHRKTPKPSSVFGADFAVHYLFPVTG
jgi:hypothetical protein